MKSAAIFCDVTSCTPIEVHPRFGRMLPSSGSKSMPSKKRAESTWHARSRWQAATRQFLVGFVLHLLFDPEDGISTFLRNVDGIL
jgi:hypothetical protein